MKKIVSLPGARRRNQRGSAMVEMAISLMGFLLLVFGVMDFGWAIYQYDACNSAAQDAVRYASVHGSQSTSPATSDTMKTYVQNDTVGLDPSRLTVTSTWDPDNNPGSTVKVVVSYAMQPLSAVAIQQGFTVSGTATSVINH